jgi:hypothetical protein
MKNRVRLCARCGTPGAIVRNEDGESVAACLDATTCLERCLAAYRPLAEQEAAFIAELKDAADWAAGLATARAARRVAS